MSESTRETACPKARPLGAWAVGVGLNPIALAAYELMHLGRSSSLGVLLRIGIALLAVLELLELSIGPLPWTVTIVTQSIVTAGWVRVVYGVESQRLPGFYYPGLLLAVAVYIPIAFLRHTH